MTIGNRDQSLTHNGVELNPEVVSGLEETWDVGPWKSWARSDKGHANLTIFVVTEQGEFVLRVSNERKSEPGIEFETALLAHVRKRGCPVPEVIPTRSGTLYTADGPAGRFTIMSHRIVGAHCDAPDRRHLASAGAGLGQYHRAVADFPGRFLTEVKLSFADADRQAEAWLDTVAGLARPYLAADEWDRLTVCRAAVVDGFARSGDALAGGLPETVIHGSYGRSALLFGPAGELSAVLDLDRATSTWRSLDLAYALKGFSRDPDRVAGAVGLSPDRAREFLSAYLAEHPLEASELERLPHVMAAQRLIKMAGKARNLLVKHEIAPQAEKDVRKVTAMLDEEERTLRWLAADGAGVLPTPI